MALGPILRKRTWSRTESAEDMLGDGNLRDFFLFNNDYYDFVIYLNLAGIHIMFTHYTSNISRLKRKIPNSYLFPLSFRTICCIKCLPHPVGSKFLEDKDKSLSLINNNSYMSIISHKIWDNNDNSN